MMNPQYIKCISMKTGYSNMYMLLTMPDHFNAYYFQTYTQNGLSKSVDCFNGSNDNLCIHDNGNEHYTS